MAQRALPAPARSRLVVGLAPEALQIAQRIVAQHDHGAPAPAVPSVWPAAGHVRFATEAHASIAARARLDVDPRAIMEQRDHPDIRRSAGGCNTGGGAARRARASN